MLKQIIYIAGEGRSGSTILDRTLGGIEGVSSFNEMHVILKPDYLDEQLCSCGEPPDQCPFWTAVNADLARDFDLDRMQKLSAKFDRSGAMPRLFFGLIWGNTRRELREYAAFCKAQMEAIAYHAECDTIVDSSKVPTRSLILRRYADLDVYTIHLVRHPGAVAASWARKKVDPSLKGDMTQYSKNRSYGVWIYKQLTSELLRFGGPYLPLRYEKFAKSPRSTVTEIMNFVPGLMDRETRFLSEREVDLPPLHSLSGNPDRFQSGPTEIREDKKWKSAEAGGLGIWSVILFPFMLRYGYAGRDPS